jgi:HAD superfamily hydrolase (TIGR01509 family)
MRLWNEPWGVIFDVDGTMVNNLPYHQQAWIELGRRRGLPITAEFYRANIHSRSNDVISRTLFGEDVSPALAHAVAVEKETIYRDLYRPHVKAIAGLTTLLEAFRAEAVPLGIASNSPLPNVTFILDALDIADYFPVIVPQRDEVPGKPQPDVFLEAAAQMDLPPSRCLVFEDSFSGFQAAERAGMPFIAITEGSAAESLKQAARAKGRYSDFIGLTVEQLHRLLLTP